MAGPWADLDEASGSSAGRWNQLLALNEWDRCVLGGFDLPGTVNVTATPGRVLQRQPKAGKNNEKLHVVRYDPANVDIEIRIWTEDQYNELVRIMKILFPKNTGEDDTAHPIDARALDMFTIKSVRITKCSALSPGPIPKTMRIQAVEFVASTQTTKSAAKSVKLKDRPVARKVNQVQQLGKKTSEEQKKTKPSKKKSNTNNPNFTATTGQ